MLSCFQYYHPIRNCLRWTFIKLFSAYCHTSNTLNFFISSAWEKRAKSHVWNLSPLDHPSGAPLSLLLGIITLKNNTPVALQLQKTCTFPPVMRWKFSMLTEGFCASFLKETHLWNLEKYVGPSKVGMANGKTRCVIGNWDISAKRETPP